MAKQNTKRIVFLIMSTLQNIKRAVAFLCVISTYMLPFEVIAQGSAGSMFPHKLGISYQKGLAIDLGLLSYNRWSDRNTTNFYDISLGTDVYLTKPFTVAPKLSLDFGVGDWLMIGGGVDIAMPTDFSRSTWMLTQRSASV